MIKSKHIDFLICDLSSRPVMAIEPDGSSHNSPKRIERDKLVDKIYKNIGLPIKPEILRAGILGLGVILLRRWKS